MRRNKTLSLLLALCLLFTLCACGGQDGSTGEENPDAQQGTSGETGAEETDLSAVKTVALQKQIFSLCLQENETLPLTSEFSHVTLWAEDADEYPALAEALEQRAAMIRRSMEDEFDNLCASAKEELPWTKDDFGPWVSTLDIQVRRADSVVISLLSDSYANYGWIEDFRGMYGTNYDAQTGAELALNDVVDVNNALAEAVLKELNNHLWAGDFYSENAVEEYFSNTSYDDFSWTLDYSGITFYFADGELTEPGNGRQTAMVSFAEYPELFNEKYMAAPNAYMVELPMDHSFFTDLDGNGDLEELNITAWYNTDEGAYTKFGIYNDTDGCYRYEECLADGFTPYYVKTAAGNHYLYLFCRQRESVGPIPVMHLVVFDLSGGSATQVGKMRAAPGYIPTEIYRVPTDPEHFYLDAFDSEAQDMMPYAIGATGLPEPK